MRKWVGRVLVASLVAVSSLGAPPVVSQAWADDASQARELFQQAITLEEGGQFAEALKKFREVLKLKRTPQVLYHIGLCLEKTGLWPDALDHYKQAAQLANQSNDAKLNEVKAIITEATASLDKRLPTLTIKRGKGARNASVTLDGKKLEGPLREPMRVMPGKHTVQARAKDKDNFKATAELAEGESKVIEVTLENIDDGPEPAPEPTAAPKKEEGGRSVAPYVVMGLGVAGFAASGVFYLLRSKAEGELRDQCEGIVCPTSAKAKGDEAKSMNNLSNISMGVGAAGLVIGATWYLLSGDSKPAEKTEKSASIRLRLDAPGATLGAGFSGAF